MYLVFDTETSGLPKKWSAPISDTNNWPRVAQLSWVVLGEPEMPDKFPESFYVYPDGWEVEAGAAEKNGLTMDVLRSKGEPIDIVLARFSRALKQCQYLVAHNLEFDEKVMACEYLRMSLTSPFNGMTRICTKEMSTNYCNLLGQYGPKWPKLEELHRVLFGEDPEDQHEADSDVITTQKCFAALVERGVIVPEDVL